MPAAAHRTEACASSGMGDESMSSNQVEGGGSLRSSIMTGGGSAQSSTLKSTCDTSTAACHRARPLSAGPWHQALAVPTGRQGVLMTFWAGAAGAALADCMEATTEAASHCDELTRNRVPSVGDGVDRRPQNGFSRNGMPWQCPSNQTCTGMRAAVSTRSMRVWRRAVRSFHVKRVGEFRPPQ